MSAAAKRAAQLASLQRQPRSDMTGSRKIEAMTDIIATTQPIYAHNAICTAASSRM